MSVVRLSAVILVVLGTIVFTNSLNITEQQFETNGGLRICNDEFKDKITDICNKFENSAGGHCNDINVVFSDKTVKKRVLICFRRATSAATSAASSAASTINGCAYATGQSGTDFAKMTYIPATVACS